MRVPAASAVVALSISAFAWVAGCRPIETKHAFKHEFPTTRTDFTVRWIGSPSGHVATWISTADDLEANGRYEGIEAIVDPGSPEDVETHLIPYLESKGLPPGSAIAYVVVSTGDPQAQAGATRLARSFKVGQIVQPAPVDPNARKRGAYGGALPDYLKLGPEVTARLVRPKGTGGIPADALVLRFIDVQFLLLPALDRATSDAYAVEIAESLERQAMHSTVVFSRAGLSPAAAEKVEAEVLVGGSEASTSPLHFASPAKGQTLELMTNGSEMRAEGPDRALRAGRGSAPGPLHRSRYGHWLDCRTGAEAECSAELDTPEKGPLMVSLAIAGQEPGWFLLDTRAPVSYLVRPRYQKIPGWENASGHAHGHGGGAIGLEIPSFAVSKGLAIHHWHVLPIDPFEVNGRPVAGVIGMDLLQSFRLTWAPATARLTLAPNFSEERTRLTPAAETKTVEGASLWQVPMDRSPAGPLILATLDGIPKSLIVDLASERTAIYLKPDDFSARVTKSEPLERWEFTVADDISEAGWRKIEVKAGPLPIKDLNLFGVHFPGATALAVDKPLDSDVLGLDFLGEFMSVSLDFRRRSIELTR